MTSISETMSGQTLGKIVVLHNRIAKNIETHLNVIEAMIPLAKLVESVALQRLSREEMDRRNSLKECLEQGNAFILKLAEKKTRLTNYVMVKIADYIIEDGSLEELAGALANPESEDEGYLPLLTNLQEFETAFMAAREIPSSLSYRLEHFCTPERSITPP